MTGLILFIVILVNVVSAFFAGSGLRALTRETPQLTDAAASLAGMFGILSAEGWHFAFCLAVTGVLQAGITIIWTGFFRERGLTLLSIGLGLSAASALLTAVYIVLVAEDYLIRQQARQDAVAPARGALAAFSDGLNHAAAGLRLASSRAAELAETEINDGGTCPGTIAAGEGPRERMRDRHADIAGNAAEDARQLADAALQLDLALQWASGAELQEVFREAVTLSRSPALGELRRSLTPIYTDLTSGWEDGGRFYECPTPDFLQIIEEAIANLDGIPVVPTDIPLDAPPSTTDANRLIWTSLLALVQGTALPSASALMAIVGASLIELVQIGLMRRREVSLCRRGLVEDRYETAWGGGAGRARKRPHLRAVVTALDRFTWHDGRDEYLAVPRDSGSPTARIPVAYFGLRPAHPSLRNFDLGRIDPHWVAARGLEGARFDLYALPRDLNDWRKIADRDLVHAAPAKQTIASA